MISDKAFIVINRCQSTLCRRVVVLIPGHAEIIEVLETGSDTCEHVFDPARVVTVRRDVLILHALWTAGRHAVAEGIDPRAHVLADTLGYRSGDAVPITEIPLQLVFPAGHELTWQGMCAASRVARAVRELRPVTATHVDRWTAISAYLARWQHHVM